MLMLYISCMIVALVLNVFSVAANMGLHAARGVKPFQTNIIVALVASSLYSQHDQCSRNLVRPR